MGCPAASRAAANLPPTPPAGVAANPLLDGYFRQFEQVYDERYQKRYGFWRPVVTTTIEKFLACGDLREGFARVRCPSCRHEFCVAFSCRRRCLCPSCHQKRALIMADHIAGNLCAPVAHRQFVFTIPKRLRIFFRFDRRLLGELVHWHPHLHALVTDGIGSYRVCSQSRSMSGRWSGVVGCIAR